MEREEPRSQNPLALDYRNFCRYLSVLNPCRNCYLLHRCRRIQFLLSPNKMIVLLEISPRYERRHDEGKGHGQYSKGWGHPPIQNWSCRRIFPGAHHRRWIVTFWYYTPPIQALMADRDASGFALDKFSFAFRSNCLKMCVFYFKGLLIFLTSLYLRLCSHDSWSFKFTCTVNQVSTFWPIFAALFFQSSIFFNLDNLI